MIFISVICPVYNEAEYIRDIMEFFIKAQPEMKELIIIDGGSTDKTKEIVSGYSEKYPQIRLIDNPDKYVPFALNAAIQNSTGDPLIRLDAHTVYAPDYFTKIIETFNRTGADIAGGPMRAIGNSHFQKAVAMATSTSFGVGDSAFHDETFEGYTDSVYLGSWRRTVFKDVGLFDTDMIRNQDDEFHYRAKSMGKKIYLNPEIKSWYYPRSTVASLFSQYFQYGLFKPLVLRKVKSGMRLRHLVPSGFVVYLALLILFHKLTLIYLPGLFYILLSFLFAVISSRHVLIALNMMLVYPVVHLAYGLGFIKGLITLWTGKKPSL